MLVERVAAPRLRDAALSEVIAALEAARVPVEPATLRLVRAARAGSPQEASACLGPYVEHPDRDLGLAVLSALGRGRRRSATDSTGRCGRTPRTPCAVSSSHPVGAVDHRQ